MSCSIPLRQTALAWLMTATLAYAWQMNHEVAESEASPWHTPVYAGVCCHMLGYTTETNRYAAICQSLPWVVVSDTDVSLRIDCFVVHDTQWSLAWTSHMHQLMFGTFSASLGLVQGSRRLVRSFLGHVTTRRQMYIIDHCHDRISNGLILPHLEHWHCRVGHAAWCNTLQMSRGTGVHDGVSRWACCCLALVLTCFRGISMTHRWKTYVKWAPRTRWSWGGVATWVNKPSLPWDEWWPQCLWQGVGHSGHQGPWTGFDQLSTRNHLDNHNESCDFSV